MICETILLMIIMFGLRIDGRRLASVAHAAHSLHDSRPRFRIPNDLHVLPTPESGASSSDEIFTQQRIAEPKRNGRREKKMKCVKTTDAQEYRTVSQYTFRLALLYCSMFCQRACVRQTAERRWAGMKTRKKPAERCIEIYAVCANPRHKYHVISLKC